MLMPIIAMLMPIKPLRLYQLNRCAYTNYRYAYANSPLCLCQFTAVLIPIIAMLMPINRYAYAN